MTSKRMLRRLANRRPHWLAKAEKAQRCGADGAAAAYDRTRYHIRHVLPAERDEHWQALTIALTEFNSRLETGAATRGRVAEGERGFKARLIPVEAADAQYDTARRHIRQVEPADEQERLWRALEMRLQQFNERFTRDRNKAAA